MVFAFLSHYYAFQIFLKRLYRDLNERFPLEFDVELNLPNGEAVHYEGLTYLNSPWLFAGCYNLAARLENNGKDIYVMNAANLAALLCGTKTQGAKKD